MKSMIEVGCRTTQQHLYHLIKDNDLKDIYGLISLIGVDTIFIMGRVPNEVTLTNTQRTLFDALTDDHMGLTELAYLLDNMFTVKPIALRMVIEYK